MKPHNNPAIIAPISQMRKLKLCDLSLRLSGGAQIQTQAVYLKSPGVYPWSNLPPAQATEVWNKFLTSGMAFKAFPNLDTTAFGNTAPSPFPSSNHCALHASQSPIHSAFLLLNTLVHALLSSVTSLAPPCPIKTDTASFRALFKCPYPWAPFLPQARPPHPQYYLCRVSLCIFYLYYTLLPLGWLYTCMSLIKTFFERRACSSL